MVLARVETEFELTEELLVVKACRMDKVHGLLLKHLPRRNLAKDLNLGKVLEVKVLRQVKIQLLCRGQMVHLNLHSGKATSCWPTDRIHAIWSKESCKLCMSTWRSSGV